MHDTTSTPAQDGLADEDRLAVQTLYRAFGEGDPDLLDDALTADWQDITGHPKDWFGRLHQMGAWPTQKDLAS